MPLSSLLPRRLALAGLVLLGAVAGCAHRAATAPAPAGGPDGAPVGDVLRIPLPGLIDVACAPDCLALTARGLVKVPEYTPIAIEGLPAGATALSAGPSGWSISAPCPDDVGTPCRFALSLSPPAVGPPSASPAPAPRLVEDAPPLDEQLAAFQALFHEIVARGWRIPFRRTLVGPGGGPIALARIAAEGGHLVSSGPPLRSAQVVLSPSPASWPAPLSLAPGGRELYVVAWPSPMVHAYDPATLEPRWSVALDGAAQGLFVDPGGRFLLVAEGTGQTDRFFDWPLPDPAPPFLDDPTGDEHLRTEPRPAKAAAVAIDLALHGVAVRVPGAYRRWLTLPGAPSRYLLATDQELVFYTPPEPAR